MLILTPPWRTAGVLGEDRDALLALQVDGIHDPLVDVLVRAKRTRLPEHGVDERRLPMIDMGDDGDIAKIISGSHGGAW